MPETNENMIEFISGQRTAVLTLTNRKHINRIKAIYAERKDDFKFYHENKDGSICVKIPLKWIKINPGAKPDPDKPKRELSPEHKAKLLEALKRGRAAKK